MNSPKAWRVALLLLGLSLSVRVIDAQVAQPRDVLVVMVDDIGLADLDELRTEGFAPNIEALAARGLEFRCMIGAPTCGPSRLEAFFSRYSFRDPGTGSEPAPIPSTPPASWPSLADYARSAGMATGLFGKWHLGPAVVPSLPEAIPLTRGFDACSWVFPTPGPVNLTYTAWTRATAPGGPGSPPRFTSQYLPRVIKDDLLAWWNATPGPRLAVWTVTLAHGPFHHPPASLVPPGLPFVPGQRGLFREMIAAMDRHLGEVLDAVGPDVAVIFIGDNGTPPQVSPIDPYTGLPFPAKTTTYERGLLIPFIMAGPGIRQGVSSRLCSLVDILPTTMDLIGSPTRADVDGVSVFAREPHKIVLAGDGGEGVESDFCARSARFKLRRYGDGFSFEEKLYDLRTDPDEHDPLDPALYPAVTLRLRAALYPRLPPAIAGSALPPPPNLPSTR